jgi:sec-independent protein translocase protein TatB
MFDIGWSELLVIGMVALVVIGPKELPTVLRTVGQWMTKIRRMASEFQGQFQEAMREAEMDELKKNVDSLNQAAQNLGSDFNPVGDIEKDIKKSFDSDMLNPETPPPSGMAAPTSEPASAPSSEAPAPTSHTASSTSESATDPAPEPRPATAGTSVS